MALFLVALFIGTAVLEVAVIQQAGDLLGWNVTILILIADSVFGALLVRQEGTRAWRRFVQGLASGTAPAREIVEGALILFGGALLLTPGFVTDVVGLACVLGPTRKGLASLLVKRFAVAAGPLGSMFLRAGADRGEDGRAAPRGASDQPPGPPRPSRPEPPPPGVIDVEVLDVKRNPRRPDRG